MALDAVRSKVMIMVLLLFIHCYRSHCEWVFVLVPYLVVWFLVPFEFSNHHFEEERAWADPEGGQGVRTPLKSQEI